MTLIQAIIGCPQGINASLAELTSKGFGSLVETVGGGETHLSSTVHNVPDSEDRDAPCTVLLLGPDNIMFRLLAVGQWDTVQIIAVAVHDGTNIQDVIASDPAARALWDSCHPPVEGVMQRGMSWA